MFFVKEKVLRQLLGIFAAEGNHATDDGWKMNSFKRMTVVNFIETVERQNSEQGIVEGEMAKKKMTKETSELKKYT